jgi:hypothetical protein
MTEPLHFPWTVEELKSLLNRMIPLGESEKIDLKTELNLSDGARKHEFVKDVAAIANTKGDSYQGFGFLIFGAEPTKGLVYTEFHDGMDKIQSEIDACLNSCLTPFVRTQFFIFDDHGQQWGALAIAPSREIPHVLIKNLIDSVRGDVFVRLGSTTEKAGPADYARVFNYRFEDATYELREQNKTLTLDVASLKEQLRNLGDQKGHEAKINTEPDAPEGSSASKSIIQEAGADDFEYESLNEKIEKLLNKKRDPIGAELIHQAQYIKNLLEKDHIPWELRSMDKKGVEQILSEIEEYSFDYWRSLFLLTVSSESESYELAIVKSFQVLASKSDAPVGTPFTEFGRSIRYLPLFVSLYIVFIGCIYSRNPKLLREILSIEVRGRTSYDTAVPIPFILIYTRAIESFLKPLHPNFPNQTWIDPCAAYVQSLLKRILIWDDPFWDFETEFFKGEFVLCLTPLDFPSPDGVRPLLYPIQGSYLHFNAAINSIKKMLKKDRAMLEKIFVHPFKPILEKFDEVGGQMVTGFGGDGFTHGAADAAFQSMGDNKSSQ